MRCATNRSYENVDTVFVTNITPKLQCSNEYSNESRRFRSHTQSVSGFSFALLKIQEFNLSHNTRIRVGATIARTHSIIQKKVEKRARAFALLVRQTDLTVPTTEQKKIREKETC